MQPCDWLMESDWSIRCHSRMLGVTWRGGRKGRFGCNNLMWGLEGFVMARGGTCRGTLLGLWLYDGLEQRLKPEQIIPSPRICLPLSDASHAHTHTKFYNVSYITSRVMYLSHTPKVPMFTHTHTHTLLVCPIIWLIHMPRDAAVAMEEIFFLKYSTIRQYYLII